MVSRKQYNIYYINSNSILSKGLGWFSEQCFEAMHADMKIEWEWVKILNADRWLS